MKKAKFPPQSIELFDWWLGTRRKNTIKSLNPLQFSLDCEIDIRHALSIFSHCVYDKDIKLLKQKAKINCPSCSHRITNKNGNNYICNNCGYIIAPEILNDSTEIVFELLKEPTGEFVHPPMVVDKGKAKSLRISYIKQFDDDDGIRRLYDCF